MSFAQLMINTQITKNIFSKVIYLRQVTFSIYGRYHTFCSVNRSLDVNRSLCFKLSTFSEIYQNWPVPDNIELVVPNTTRVYQVMDFLVPEQFV